MTEKMGADKAKKFADVHEMPYLLTQPELCYMDLHNNNLGREIALKYKGQGPDVFANKIIEAIEEGRACVLLPDEGN